MKQDNSKKSMISVVMPDKASLYSAYMPFLLGGGLFISTEHGYELGDSVFIRLKLPGEPDPVPVACRVVWCTLSEKSLFGIGLQFLDDDLVQGKIESYLIGSLGSDKPTATM